MCTPATNAVSTISSLFSGALNLTTNTLNYKNTAKNLEYRTQAAINNAQTAKSEALRQRQLGIDEARQEKISGIQEASKQLTANAAGGFDAASETNLYAYEDTINEANTNAKIVKEKYNAASDTYFQRANNYLDEAREIQSDYNSLAYSSALNALGSVQKVAKSWFGGGAGS